jgi:hypothetical protein
MTGREHPDNAAHMRGHELLTTQELTQLRQRSNLMGVSLVAHAWVIIAAGITR